jgi:hypothetical protein
MKGKFPFILLFFLVWAPFVYGADIESRLQALEAIIKEQQKTIEKQQQEINALRAEVVKEDKISAPEKLLEASTGQTKKSNGEMAYPTTPVDRKYSESPRPLEIYSLPRNKLIPDISFIVDGSYLGRNVNDETFNRLAVPGLIPPGTSASNRGFNLNYGELSLFSQVDPYFDLSATIPFSSDGVELEEAFFRTTSLPWGFQMKGGKFRSSFGRLNVQHEHVWDFADAPLINRAFFGEDGLVEKGVQLNWLAPTPLYLLVGGELLQGENSASFGTGAVSWQKNGISYSQDSPQQPSLLVTYLKSSADFGSLSLLGGLSYAQGQTRQNGSAGQMAYGDAKIYGLDLTAKYFIDSYRYLSWQNEYMYRHMNLSAATDLSPDNPDQPLTLFGKELKQSGFYSQLVYRFAQRWRIGARYDRFIQNDIYVNGLRQDLPGGLDRISAMLEFKPSEFSTLRLQFNRDNSLFDGTNREPVNSVFLQFNMAIGAHGAHAY